MDDMLEKQTEKQTEKKKTSSTQMVFDYKDPVTLYNFITEGGKILPRRLTGLSHGRQQQLRNAVKKARRLNLLPTGIKAYDSFARPTTFSKKPFSLSG